MTYHFSDAFRSAVFEGDEEALLRLAAHLQACSDCIERALLLVDWLTDPALRCNEPPTISCTLVRSALLRYFEQASGLGTAVLHHLHRCEVCGDNLIEAARRRYTLAVYGDVELAGID